MMPTVYIVGLTALNNKDGTTKTTSLDFRYQLLSTISFINLLLSNIVVENYVMWELIEPNYKSSIVFSAPVKGLVFLNSVFIMSL